MAFGTAAPPGSQEAEPVPQAGHDLGQPERRHPGRRQLERKGQAVETPAQGAEQRRRPRLDLGRRARGPGPGDEQLHRIGPRHEVEVALIPRCGDGERGHHPHHLAGHPQRLAARGHDRDGRGVAQEPVGDDRRGLHHVLAVVEHQQRLVAAEGGAEAVDRRGGRRCVGDLADGERRRDLVGHDVGCRPEAAPVHTGEVDEPGPVGPVLGDLPSGLERQRGLAHAPRADERDQVGGPDRLDQRGEVAVPADQRRAAARQVGRRAPHRRGRSAAGAGGNGGVRRGGEGGVLHQHGVVERRGGR